MKAKLQIVLQEVTDGYLVVSPEPKLKTHFYQMGQARPLNCTDNIATTFLGTN